MSISRETISTNEAAAILGLTSTGLRRRVHKRTLTPAGVVGPRRAYVFQRSAIENTAAADLAAAEDVRAKDGAGPATRAMGLRTRIDILTAELAKLEADNG